MSVIEDMEKVTGTSEYFLLGRWVEQAKALANNADDFTKELYEFNAKALVTTWGSKNQAEKGGLKDYSNRQWSGLIGDFYKARWQRWITARTNELSGTDYESNIDWFESVSYTHLEELKRQVKDLERLLVAYRNGELREKR